MVWLMKFAGFFSHPNSYGEMPFRYLMLQIAQISWIINCCRSCKMPDKWSEISFPNERSLMISAISIHILNSCKNSYCCRWLPFKIIRGMELFAFEEINIAILGYIIIVLTATSFPFGMVFVSDAIKLDFITMWVKRKKKHTQQWTHICSLFTQPFHFSLYL